MKSNRCYLLFLSLLFGCLQSVSAKNIEPEPIVKDSVHLREIIVTGTRSESVQNKLPMSITIIDSKQIENRREQSLLPILNEEVPGLFVTSRGVMGYGVAAGAAGGMSIRGIGGSPTTGVLILIDGHPQYMGLMGHPLADSYQSMLAERVEVVRGAASVLYGSNAMGGVVNIITKKNSKNGILTTIRSMYGSYNTLNAEIDNSYRKDKFNSYVSASYNRTDGHRANMEFDQYSVYTKFGYDMSSNWKTYADLNLTRYNASNPGSESKPIEDNDAKVTRGVSSLSVENNYDKTSGAVKFYYNFGKHEIDDGYYPLAQPQKSHFHSKDKMMGLTVYQNFRFADTNLTTFGVDYQHFGGTAWNRSRTDGSEVSLIAKTMYDLAAYANVQQSIGRSFVLNAGVRSDYNELNGLEIIPQGGISYVMNEETVIKAIVSKSFRNPTIRELYMFAPQNPDLEAERLMNYELSYSKQLLNRSLTVDVSLYYINGDNSIQTIMVAGKPKYMNTGKVENYGIEIASRYYVNPHLHFSTNYSYLDMKNKVVAAPEHKMYVGANYTRQKWSASSGLQYIHNLYTVVNPQTAKESFALWNVRIAYKPSRMIELFAKGENMLNEKYEVNAGYPMPQTTVFGGVQIKI